MALSSAWFNGSQTLLQIFRASETNSMCLWYDTLGMAFCTRFESSFRECPSSYRLRNTMHGFVLRTTWSPIFDNACIIQKQMSVEFWPKTHHIKQCIVLCLGLVGQESFFDNRVCISQRMSYTRLSKDPHNTIHSLRSKITWSPKFDTHACNIWRKSDTVHGCAKNHHLTLTLHAFKNLQVLTIDSQISWVKMHSLWE